MKLTTISTLILVTASVGISSVSAQGCGPALQASFDQCIRNIVLGSSPEEACRADAADQSKWYACLCDRSVNEVYCYDSYCTADSRIASAKQKSEQYCRADSTINPNRVKSGANNGGNNGNSSTPINNTNTGSNTNGDKASNVNNTQNSKSDSHSMTGFLIPSLVAGSLIASLIS